MGRTLLYFTLIAMVLAGGGYYLLLDGEKKAAEESRKQQAARAAWSRSAIDLKELYFSAVHLKDRSYGPYKALDGVVANNAKHALGEFDVEVTLKDCEDKTKETMQGRWTSAWHCHASRSERSNAALPHFGPAVR